jgi:protein-tyrosine phosphatase
MSANLIEGADWNRVLPLESAFNLRDFGGYPTEGGGHVRRGMLYRSGSMHALSEEDERHLRGLGIVTVCDLRRVGERERYPTRWCDGEGIDLLSRDHHQSSGVLEELLRGEPTAADVRAMMIDLYRVLADEHAPSYRIMFERLLAGKAPLLLNCMAGKDRTGVGAALVLSALGVPRETIVEDYVMTAQVLDFARLINAGGRSEHYWKLPAEVIAPLRASDREYLESMFDALDARHGGVEGFLAAEIGVGADERGRLRALLVD